MAFGWIGSTIAFGAVVRHRRGVGRYSEISHEQITRALARRVREVKAHKARLAFRTFEVVEQRNQDLWRPTRKRVGLRAPSFEALVEKALKAEFPKK